MAFPPELYSEILKNFDHPSHRKDLLSMSLVNRVSRIESQRVLFRQMYDSFKRKGGLCSDNSRMSWKEQSVIGRHFKFLQSVIASPRLASYVRLYAQHGLAAQPACGKDAGLDFPDREVNLDNNKRYTELWEVTERALPLLINLKHLHLAYNSYRQAPPVPQNILSGCPFQLKSLYFVCSYYSQGYRCGTNKLHLTLPFLRTQTGLDHLAVGQDSGYQNPDVPRNCLLDDSWLPADICRRVPSFSCDIRSIPYLARHNIQPTALELWAELQSKFELCHRDLLAIQRVKYLSILSHERLCKTMPCPGALDNLILLEIHLWSSYTIEHLDEYALPSLRIISFIQYTSYNRGRVPAEQCREVARRSFLSFPKLHYVIVQDEPVGGVVRRTKWVRKRHSPDLPGAEECGMEEEVVYLDQHYGRVWWQSYETA